jgi:hypothetical protein
METLLVVIAIIAAIFVIAGTFVYGYHLGMKQQKTELNKLTVREMLVHKREKFNSL